MDKTFSKYMLFFSAYAKFSSAPTKNINNHISHRQYKISARAIPETYPSDRGLRIACQT